MKNPKFIQLLRQQRDKDGRSMTIARLAEKVGSHRDHLTRVLLNIPGHGRRTRKKLLPHITPAMREALEWDELGRHVPPRQPVAERKAAR